MNDRRNARIGFPTEEEMTLVRQLVKDELGRLGITVKSISRLPSGATEVGAQIPAEKMSAGRYVGDVCLYALRAAAREDVFSEKAAEFISGMTCFETPVADKWGSGKLPKELRGDDAVNAVYIINEIFNAAARCVACTLCGILMLTGDGAYKPVCIAVDGSLYKKSRLFKPALYDYMAVYAGEIMGRKYEFVTADEATILGTAAGALLN